MIDNLLHKSYYYITQALTITLLLCCTCTLSAQETQHTLHLRSGKMTPVANATHWLDSTASTPFREPVQVLIHFHTLPTTQERAKLFAQGIELLEYVPDNTFTAIIRHSVDAADVATVPLHSIIAPKPEWKADDIVWQQVASQKGKVEVLVSCFNTVPDSTVRNHIALLGGQINPSPKEAFGAYQVIISAPQVKTLAAWYGVRCISPIRDIVSLDLQNRAAMKANNAGNAPLYIGYGLQGDSICIGIGDESSGIYHADLKDRVVNFNSNPISHHGEHVTGIVGSAGNVDPMATGMCPHATLIDYLFDFILPVSGKLFHDYNMTITNNSYAVIVGDCNYAGTYDGYAQLVDTLAIEYPQVMDVFASANDGYLTCSPYLPGFATVTGGYQPAKNNIVVGSMTDFYVQRYDESRGPVKDGRLKPEIIAIGWPVYSCINRDGYMWSAGTSMASPGVAGGLGLITQRYKQLHNNNVPRGDVLKAVTLNGCLDLGNPGPDFSYGFGGMDIGRSLLILDSNHYSTSSINNGDSQNIIINIPANTVQVKVMLTWIDPVGSTYASKELVNDLDLTVTMPGGTVHYPLVLDPTPANVNNNATEQPDHLNNVEQVTITHPVSGNYTISVKGFHVPFPSQNYAIAYDIIPNGILLTYPLGGEAYNNTDSFRVFWDGIPNDNNPLTLELSTDSGTTWNTLNNNLPFNQYHWDTVFYGINSSNCMIRLTHNGTTESVTSGTFMISQQPIIKLDTAQCPGYVNIHWQTVPKVTSYLMMEKIGPYMQVIDSIADTAYTFKGMSLTDYSYVAICPIMNGKRGYRSLSAIVLADSGNCSMAVSNGDLIITKVLSPQSGRLYTSTQLGTNDTLSLVVQNLYNADCNNYSIAYNINSGAWQSATFTTPIPANNKAVVKIPGINLSDTIAYTITAAITNLQISDPYPANDTISFTVRNLPNDSIRLTTPFFDGFEDMSIETVANDSVGVSPNCRWDFFTKDSFGRMRTFLMDGFAITGNRSISMDNSRYVPPGTNNQFIGTFNLSGYDTLNTEIRVDFDYFLCGQPSTASGNLVEVRPNDQAPWMPFFNYNLTAYPGAINHVQSLSLTDAMRAAGQDFSTSTQVSFGQNDISLICTSSYGSGTTIDNVKLYTVQNDAALAGIVSPLPANCGLVSPIPLTIQVHNGVNIPLHNVQLFYTIDGGAVNTGAIDSIPPKGTITYTFPTTMTISSALSHTLSVWLSETGDSYKANDSILNYQFKNSPVISTFPYLENFESGSGSYYSAGINDCWQYGTPASPKIHKAASGTKAWKTNLNGNYNNMEQSYIYSPCFDIASLSNPMLSFSAALDVENCGGTLCDQAYIEYSFDNITWQKLGSTGQGTNWYDSTFNIWNTEGETRWHVASILLPKPPAGDLLHLRFALVSDPGGTYEGFAVDDIHIFDISYPILKPDTTVAVSSSVSGNSFTDITQNNQVLCSLQPNGQTISAINNSLFLHDTLYNTGATQYTLPRSFAVKAADRSTDSVTLRLYITDSEVVKTVNDTTCPSCYKVKDAYSLGITRFENNNNPALENNTLADDTGGVFSFLNSYPTIQWIPYDQGYYAQFNTKPVGEFWFNNGGPTGNVSLAASYLDFAAFRTGNRVKLCWYAPIDTAVQTYSILKSTDSINFTDILDTSAVHTSPTTYFKYDSVRFYDTTAVYYKLKWNMTHTDSVLYSPVRKVNFFDTASNLVDFTAQMINSQDVQLNWTSFIDGITDHYIIQRAIDNGDSKIIINPFISILSRSAVHTYGQSYSSIDIPNINLKEWHNVYYLLTAVLMDGTQVQMPIRDVIWKNNNTLGAIYPNPTGNGIINIDWYANAGTPMQVTITDAAGQKIYQTNSIATQWNNTTTLTTGYHPAGVYFVTITIGGNKQVVEVMYK